MRVQYLSPHQLESYRPFVDTLIITTYAPFPLDPAVPCAASMWIADTLAQRVQDNFVGRASTLPLGVNLQDISPGALSAWQGMWIHPVRGALCIVDRTLLRPSVVHRGKFPVVYADWWQWLRSAVPTQRWSDAWLYLCMAIQPYRQSEERQYAGLPQERCEGMAKEGGRLLSAMEDWLVHQISVLWHTMEQSGENATESYRTY